MPRVLLYEPGDSGHRPVILRYLVKGLPSAGWEPVVYRDLAYQQLRDCDLIAIEDEARRRGCGLIHLLTIDGCVRNWLRPRKKRTNQRIPIIGTYYLFNNLWGVRGLVWMAAVWMGYIDKILVSDPYIEKRWLVPGLRKHIGFIPDPWCREEFPYVDQIHARNRLGLPLGKKIVLVFGEISQRKGVKRILAALQLVQRDDLVVVLAGRVNADSKADIELSMNDSQVAKKLIVHDRHIAEVDVSAYFYASHAILSDYPKWFKVSSGAFTRALAAGRLPLVPDHGVNSKMIMDLGFGLCYESESVDALGNCLNCEICFDGNDCVVAEAERREVTGFVKSIILNYILSE